MRIAKLMIFFAVLVTTLFCCEIKVFANNTVVKEKTFTCESQDDISYDKFDDVITDGSKEYELENIKYEYVRKEDKVEKVDKTTTIKKDGLSSKSYSVDSNASYYHQTVKVDGKEYEGTLIDVRYEDIMKEQRYGEVSGTKDYGLRSSKPTPPDTMTLPYYDEHTGKNYTVQAPLKELKQTSSAWQDYTYIDIVVSNYTDTQFMFNGEIIKHNGISVLPEKHYSALLAMAGLDDDTHKINSVSWTSEPYKQGNLKCRNARANIQAYACSYTAYYYKRFELEDTPGYNATLTYKYSEENKINTIYTYKAIATYAVVEESTTVVEETIPTVATPDEIPVVVKTITTVSVLLVISLAFVLFTMFLLTKLKIKTKK